eukprot:19223-Heterococcus_DN1.PRE.1
MQHGLQVARTRVRSSTSQAQYYSDRRRFAISCRAKHSTSALLYCLPLRVVLSCNDSDMSQLDSSTTYFRRADDCA